MKNKIQMIFVYIVCVVLIIWYLLTLYAAANPNVSEQFKLYYITNDLSDWPGDRGLFLLESQNYCFSSEPGLDEPILHRDSKWNDLGEDFMYSQANSAGLFIRLDDSMEGIDWILSINVKSDVKDAELIVTLDNQKLGSIYLTENFNNSSISVPGNIIVNPSDIHHLTFSLNREIGNFDMESLSWVRQD
jgi:hypothetical protein